MMPVSHTTNECFGPLCSLWSHYPECNFVQRRLLLCSVLPRCACWELPGCCWEAPDCFFSHHEAHQPYWPVHRPVPAASWVTAHPGTLWTGRTAHRLNKQRKTYSKQRCKIRNFQLGCLVVESPLWGCIHTERDNNLSRDKIVYKVNGKTRLDALSHFVALSVSREARHARIVFSEKALEIAQQVLTLCTRVEITKPFKWHFTSFVMRQMK